ncbi:hypothetical protein MHYP_G00251260 [Metynnis hypsauchen]
MFQKGLSLEDLTRDYSRMFPQQLCGSTGVLQRQRSGGESPAAARADKGRLGGRARAVDTRRVRTSQRKHGAESHRHTLTLGVKRFEEPCLSRRTGRAERTGTPWTPDRQTRQSKTGLTTVAMETWE